MEIERLPLGQSHADKCRAGFLKWRNAPPGLSFDLAAEFMAELKAGKTIRTLTNGPAAICGLARYKKHCELNPEWRALANQLAKANAKAADALKGLGSSRAAETHCKRGHPYATYGFFRPYTGSKGSEGRLFRCCKACQQLAAQRGAKLSADVIDKVKELLRAGQSLSSFTQRREGERCLCSFVSVQRLRREDKEFDNIVSLSLQRRSLLQSQRLVAVSKPAIIRSNLRATALTGNVAGRADMLFSAISEAVSLRLPRHIRDEVMGQLFLDVEEGRVALSDIKQFARKYASDIYQEEKNRISLDAPAFRDGTGGSKLDRLSEADGMWA
jgi:hypothetical protein